MQKIILLLLLIPAGLAAQKIGPRTFDKYDSVYKVASLPDFLAGKELMKYTLLNTDGSPKYGSLQLTITKADIMKATLTGSDNAHFYNVILTFLSNTTFSTDKTTEIKIQYTDGEVLTYKNDGAYSIVLQNDPAVIGFTPKNGDKIFNTPIKSIRIATSNSTRDFQVEDKKKSLVQETLRALSNAGGF